jgi:glucuronoarabinoxylan endo-1,4-beta-xylanase
MLNNVNAWIHYAAKRYYGLLGDGLYGTTAGSITKRGYILAQYAKYVTGSTRLQATWNDATGVLEGSSYLSDGGDSVITVVINPSDSTFNLTVDLPFFTLSGKSITTSSTQNIDEQKITEDAETCRPKVTISPSSVTTLIFTKSSSREKSQMNGSIMHCNKVEGQSETSTAFGNSYRLSGKTATFDHTRNLISTNKTASNGYVKLDDRYNQLVMHVNSVTSTMNYNSAKTTLYYINDDGNVNSHDYGTVNMQQNGDFDLVFDISRNTLTDGCTGILSISNNNYTSVLTLHFGDVYFSVGHEKMFNFDGTYSNADSNLLDCLEDSSYTSLDFSSVSGIPSTENWQKKAANKNCIYYMDENATNQNPNVIDGDHCQELTLTDGGDFYTLKTFKASTATYTTFINGYEVVILPFDATVPEGVKVYDMAYSAIGIDCSPLDGTIIRANIPVLVKNSGKVTFYGSGTVSTPHKPGNNRFFGTYIKMPLATGEYTLQNVGGKIGFYRIGTTSESLVPFRTYLSVDATVSASYLPINVNETNDIHSATIHTDCGNKIYDATGRMVNADCKGILIKNGNKLINK